MYNTNVLVRIVFLSLFFIFFTNNIKAQETGKGCTDPRAKNYNAAATANDGSRRYKSVVYNPPFKYILPDEVKETSGLLYFDDALWTINDGGNLPVIYKLDPKTGTVVARTTVANAENNDWEALAQDDKYVYIGDFGNNSGNRNNLCILKIEKSKMAGSGDAVINADIIRFSYPDYPEKIERKKDNNFDCESLICIDDSLYLFSKNRGDNQTKLYRLPRQEGSYTAKLMTSFNVRGLITGADYNKTTREITLVGYTNKTWMPFIWLLYDYEGNKLFSGNKRRIDMLNIPATQTEGIAYTDGRQCVITSEGRKLFSQTAYDLNTGKWLSTTESLSDSSEILIPEVTATPNPMVGNHINIRLEHLPEGTCTIKLISEDGKLAAKKVIVVKENDKTIETKLKTRRLKPGNYLLQINTESQIIDLKCMKPND